jgi:hypothetical protein
MIVLRCGLGPLRIIEDESSQSALTIESSLII